MLHCFAAFDLRELMLDRPLSGEHNRRYSFVYFSLGCVMRSLTRALFLVHFLNGINGSPEVYVGSEADNCHLHITNFITFFKINAIILLFQIYLSQFGYLPATARNPANGGLLDSGTWSKAIMEFQGFAGINATGTYRKCQKT